MRLSLVFTVILAAAFGLAAKGASAQQLAMEFAALDAKQDCPIEEPDPVQISWTAPCSKNGWLFDTETGCRMWDWHPDPNDTAAWTGSCRAGRKEGRGVVQWFEHGVPIDRFDGAYVDGRREGPGRYEWNDDDRFVGRYADNLPNGYGVMRIGPETFAGVWKDGCLQSGDRVVAIGVPRSSCVPAKLNENRGDGKVAGY